MRSCAILVALAIAISPTTTQTIETYPWVVYVRNSNYSADFCGGSLLTDTWVMTTASCIVDVQATIKVLYGTSTFTFNSYDPNTVWRDTNLTLIHPGYATSGEGLNYNSAIVRLLRPVVFSNTIRTIPWKDTAKYFGQNPDIKTIHTLGFKKVTPTGLTLAHNRLRVLGSNECDAHRSGGYPSADYTVCLGFAPESGAPRYVGDTGSGVIVEQENGVKALAGIATWKPQSSSQDSVFLALRTDKFKDWIERWIALVPEINNQQSCTCYCPPCPPKNCPTKYRKKWF